MAHTDTASTDLPARPFRETARPTEIEHLQCWLELSELNRRICLALSGEALAVSHLVERSITAVTVHFLELGAAERRPDRAPDAVALGSLSLDEMEALLERQLGALGAHHAAELAPLVRALAARGRRAEAMVVEADAVANRVAEIAVEVIGHLQFQDYATQHLTQVSATLEQLNEATVGLQARTQDEVAGLAWAGKVDASWQQRVLDGQALSDMRSRLLKHLADASAADPKMEEAAQACVTAPFDPGSVELF